VEHAEYRNWTLSGTLTTSESVPRDELMTAPLSVNLGVTSIGVLGLRTPTGCATREPVSLALADTLTREEFLAKGWHFAGTTSISRFRCAGGFLGMLFGPLLSAVLSGPEDLYSISIAAPAA
jgi:hypothetical protein